MGQAPKNCARIFARYFKYNTRGWALSSGKMHIKDL
jgi:hypothetical protein